ncbi:MAG TPA: ATP-dependent zinc metalloprotease FtsH [Vicinamibacterales bacterium]|nr:ATP-dependent zinc metalloprotease FtsH [Vicinamibacterales bacterium]
MFSRISRQFRKLALAVGIFAVLIALTALWRQGSAAPLPEVPFSEFVRQAEAGAVKEITIAGSTLDVVLRDGRSERTFPPPAFFAANAAFVTDLARRQVKVAVVPERQSAIAVYAPLVVGFFAIALVGFAVYRVTAGRLPSMEQRAKVAEPGEATVRFTDVAGVDEAKEEVGEIVGFLREPERYAALGGRIPKGVLLVGPPGTGKTLLARAIAGEAGVPFLFASGSEFVEMYAGVGASRVRKLFKDARKHKSCIVFIDELDAVGRRRGGQSLSHEEREQTLNQLLVEMDGFDARQGIVVIAATNRQDILDPALLRPGRFDRQVVVGNPDLKGRDEILKVHAKRVSVSPDVDLRAIARGTPGFSGADLANLVNEAALRAARDGRPYVSASDFESARDKVMMGAERRSVVLTELERVNCAYHEAGHAVAAALLPGADPLHKVTIIPRGRAMGVTMQLPETDRHTYTKSYLETQVAMLMGGRVAEEVFMDHMTSGASNDIERATDIAERMVCEFGMSPLGPMKFARPGNQQEGERAHQLSEATAQRVDAEIERIVMDAYAQAKTLLERHREAVRDVAGALLQNESLDADEIKTVLARHGIAQQSSTARSVVHGAGA